MTVYKPRSAWTSSGRGGAQLTGAKLVGIAWHWPGTSQDEIGAESEAATANRLRGYRNFHVGARGWSDIGYNHAIDQAGRVWDLRGLGRVGAHAASTSNPDANHEWMGVLLILGDEERPSARMERACQDFFHDVFLPRWPGRTRDTGHGRAPGVPGAKTSCPGPFAAELIVDGVLTQRPTGDTMSWNENLTHGSSGGSAANITKTATNRLPSGYTKRAAGLLGHAASLAYQGCFGKISPNSWMRKRWPDMPDDGYSPRVYWRSGYGHARQAKEEAIANGKQIGKLAGEVAGLRNAVEQLAGNAGQPIDMSAVQAAALSGAQEAMAELSITVQVEPAQEPDGSEPDPTSEDTDA